MRSVCLLLLVVLSMAGCITPHGTYTVDTVEAAKVMLLTQQVIELAQAQGLLPPPGERLKPEQVDYRQRLLDLLFVELENSIEDVDLSALILKAKN